jgi:hypothetical protein
VALLFGLKFLESNLTSNSTKSLTDNIPELKIRLDGCGNDEEQLALAFKASSAAESLFSRLYFFKGLYAFVALKVGYFLQKTALAIMRALEINSYYSNKSN